MELRACLVESIRSDEDVERRCGQRSGLSIRQGYALMPVIVDGKPAIGAILHPDHLVIKRKHLGLWPRWSSRQNDVSSPAVGEYLDDESSMEAPSQLARIIVNVQ
jgi:hypothetical protein